MRRAWEIRQPEDAAAEDLARALGLTPLIARLLLNRGVGDAAAGRRFLSPSLQDLHDPFRMCHMDRAVERVLTALRRGEQVAVWGDYDVDGITATSLLLLFLRRIGLRCSYHIPSRLEEGYGLNIPAIDDIAAAGNSLLITVDCGVSDVEPIAHAVERGLDVLVLDHHQVPETLPAAVGILNPHRPDCEFPTRDLAAVGVAFNLVMALRAELRRRDAFLDGEEPNLREVLDLVALGTVADIVPLLDENRIITRFGLEELSAGRRPGVAALKEVAGLFGGAVSSGQVAFRLAPRINAAGRLGSAAKGVELLTTRSYSTALKLARELDAINAKRQGIEQTIYRQAAEQAERQAGGGKPGVLVLASEQWHVGVVGIVASRLVEKFGCPVVLVSLDGEAGRGSARGIDGVHLYDAMVSCADHLLAYGGHRLAAGLSIERAAVDRFRDAFGRAIDQQRAGQLLRKTVHIDAAVQPGQWRDAEVATLDQLAPHGLGNPEPLFEGRGLELRSVRAVGRDEPYHLKAVCIDGERRLDVIGFRMADRIREIDGPMDLVYVPEFNTWEGQTNLQLRLIDLRPSRG